MPEELFEHTTGQGKQENDSDEEIAALKFSEKMMDDKIDIKKFKFSDKGREFIRKATVYEALLLLFNELKK